MTSIFYHDCIESCAADSIVGALQSHAYAYGLNEGTLRKSSIEISCEGYKKPTRSSRQRVSIVSTISPFQIDVRKYKAYISATTKADHVIFNSNYVAQCFLSRQIEARAIEYRIIHTQSNPSLLRRQKRDLSHNKIRFNAVAYAHDWNAPEARLSDLKAFISRHPQIKVTFLEKDDRSKSEYADILHASDFAIDLRWRCCDSSFINDALLSGMPVFYAESGCFSEHVGEYGIGVQDSLSHPWMTVDAVPELKIEHIDAAWLIFQRIHHLLMMQLANVDRACLYNQMIDQYFTYLREIIKSKR